MNSPDSVSDTPPASAPQENEGEPPRCANTATALTSTSGISRKEAAVDSIALDSQPDTEARDDTVARLQHLLAAALKAREWAVSRVLELEALPPDVHWFVPDDDGHHCRACNLPRRNGRHTGRSS
jgi:hypothetical protein